MIPFEHGRGSDPFRHRGGDGDGGFARDFGLPDREFESWGGRLGRPAGTPHAEHGEAMGHLQDFPERVAAPRPREPRAAWIIAPLMMGATAAGVLFVLRGPDAVFAVVFEIVLALGVLWILISALFPARADRTCPSCGGQGLERLDRESTAGLVCRLCSWRDASASCFLLVEDEGPFEDVVLRERGQGKDRDSST